MENNKLVASDLVNYPEKSFIEVKDILVNLSNYTRAYTAMDSLYDMDGLEKVKRDMIAQLELLASHYAGIKKFKTMGDYLEEARKTFKAEAIGLLVDEKKISINQAEKKVYAYKYYKDRVKLMETIKAFFIKVEVLYLNYQNTLSSVVQSISLCKKDPNYKYTNN